MKIIKGNPVEFSLETKHALRTCYGIAIEDEREDGSVDVELSDGTIQRARRIHAYAWGGWLPEDLEPVYAKYNDLDYGFDEHYDEVF